MFQHRHFVLIAETIARLDCVNDDQRREIARDFAGALAGTNSNFDRERFLSCAVGKPSNGRDKAR